MNLKEAFRYQRFLDNMFDQAIETMYRQSKKVLKTHHCSKVVDGAEDFVEEEESEQLFATDDVIAFSEYLIFTRQHLGNAITKAKATTEIDIDAEVGANRLRQRTHEALKRILSFRPKKTKETGCGYSFNNEGNQAPYRYEIDVEYSDNFDREAAKTKMVNIAAEADRISKEIEMAIVNTNVDYEPMLDVNRSFEDNMELYTENTTV